MAYALEFGSTSAYARSSVSQSNISSETTLLSWKIRFRGDMVTELATTFDGFGPRILAIGNAAGGQQKLWCQIQDWGSTTVRFEIQPHAGSGTSVSLQLSRSSFSAGSYYVLYGQVGKTTQLEVSLYQSDGTHLGTATDAAIGADMVAGGYITTGAASPNGNTGAVDGIAIYNVALSGSNRWSTPAATDTGIRAYWPFDEGTGTTVANAVSGGVSLDTFSGTYAWLSGGTWDGTAGGGSTPVALTGLSEGLSGDSGILKLLQVLSGSSTGTGGDSGLLKLLQYLSASSTGQGGDFGSMGVGVALPLTGTSTGSGATSGTPKVALLLSATSAGTGGDSGLLKLQTRLGATSVGYGFDQGNLQGLPTPTTAEYLWMELRRIWIEPLLLKVYRG